MESRNALFPITVYLAAMIFCSVILTPAAAIADCSEVELTAVLVVSDIYPLDPQLELLDVAALGPVTNPSEAEMLRAIQAVQPSNEYVHLDKIGPFHLFFDEPADYGACAIVDGRDGRVVFAGTIIWSGLGSITVPAESSHSWSFPPGDPSPAPASTDILPNAYWSEVYGTEAEITAAVVEYLRGSDVVRSFGDCDSYNVVSYVYTPFVGGPYGYPNVARSVIIVSGRCGPPWNDVVSATPPQTTATQLTRVAPNPFNPRTTISFTLSRSTAVELSVFDLRGRMVKRLVDGERTSGIHSVEWDGTDAGGQSVPSGRYVARLRADEGVSTRSMTLVR